jgi:hypothetical protein
MKRFVWVAALLAAVLPVIVLPDAVAQGPSQPKLVCDRGPFSTKTFGGTQWQIYGCTDNRSVAIVTAPSSPAIPFYFLLAWIDGVYTVSGEGTGRRDLTAKAYNDIIKLTRPQIDALVKETQRSSN